MSDTRQPSRNDDTMIVYKDPASGLLHFPNPSEELTWCGRAAAHGSTFVREERPINWAGIWCTDCLESTLKEAR